MSNTNEVQEYIDEVLRQFTESITDEIFMLIQNDPTMLRRYLELIEDNGRISVNSQFGKEIKRRYGLKNIAGSRNNEPQSGLIKSYQEFET